MTSAIEHLRVVAAVLGSVGIIAACASQGQPDAATDERDAAVEPVDASDAGVTDGGAEAGACSASKLCVVDSPIDEDVALTSIWGSSATDVWAVGSGGTVLHYDGVAWEKAARASPADAAPSDFTLRGVWLARPDDVWILDGHSIRHGTGWMGPSATQWSFSPYRPDDCAPVAVRGLGSTILVARGQFCMDGSLLQRFEGWGDGGPQTIPTDYDFGIPTSIAVTRPDEFWLSASQRLSTTAIANRIFRFSPAIGDGAPPGADWQVEEFDSRTRRALFGIWGDERGVWLVGEGGTLRYVSRGGVPSKTLDVIPSPASAALRGVFGFGPDDVWAVGDASTVLHWDGLSWAKLTTPLDEADEQPDFSAVWGSSPADVWIVGRKTMLHYQENAP